MSYEQTSGQRQNPDLADFVTAVKNRESAQAKHAFMRFAQTCSGGTTAEKSGAALYAVVTALTGTTYDFAQSADILLKSLPPVAHGAVYSGSKALLQPATREERNIVFGAATPD